MYIYTSLVMGLNLGHECKETHTHTHTHTCSENDQLGINT